MQQVVKDVRIWPRVHTGQVVGEIKGVLLRFQSYASLMDVELTEEITEILFCVNFKLRDKLAKFKISASPM